MRKNGRPIVLFAACSLIGSAAVYASAARAEAGQKLEIDVPVKLEKAKVVFVFHGDAAYLVPNDDSYDANRHVQTGHPVHTGNPYAKLLAGLMEQGVQIELRGATAAANHWINKDLLPGVKVNTNAMVRVTQLEQDGYTLIYE